MTFLDCSTWLSKVVCFIGDNELLFNMDKSYTKLFHRILSSSIWDEDDKTRLVWITLLASTDEHGYVVATVTKLARDARVEVEACEVALAKFLAPDPASLTQTNEGRRIEKVEGGWRLLNHGMYRDMMNEASKREYFRLKRREYRARDQEHRKGVTMRQVVREKVAAEDSLVE